MRLHAGCCCNRSARHVRRAGASTSAGPPRSASIACRTCLRPVVSRLSPWPPRGAQAWRTCGCAAAGAVAPV